MQSWLDVLDELYQGSWSKGLQRFRSPFAFRGLPLANHTLTSSLARLALGRSDVLHSRRWFMKDDAFDREIAEKFGHDAVMWTEGDRTYVVLARARPADLVPVVGYVRANAR